MFETDQSKLLFAQLSALLIQMLAQLIISLRGFLRLERRFIWRIAVLQARRRVM